MLNVFFFTFNALIFVHSMRRIDGFRIGIKNGRNHFRDFALQKMEFYAALVRRCRWYLLLGLSGSVNDSFPASTIGRMYSRRVYCRLRPT